MATPSGAQAQPKRHLKVKSGCRTCKIRRVKCDEGRPACQRCVSSRRVCDGYGIWGGGSKVYSPAAAARSALGVVALSKATSVQRPTVSDAEHRYLDWFTQRTATKMAGMFAWDFWDNLLLQATANEPAVLHAVLALSTAHHSRFSRGLTEISDPHTSWTDVPGALEEFTLQQYNKAIGHLSQQPSSKGGNVKPVVRVTLITCAVFISLEVLRGNYRTANKHLQNGLRLLDQMKPSTPTGPRRTGSMTLVVGPKHNREVIDDWLVDTFARLNLQSTLASGTSGAATHQVLSRTLSAELPKHAYASVQQARLHIDRLMNNIICLQADIECEEEIAAEHLAERNQIQDELRMWHRAFTVYQKEYIDFYNIKDRLAATVLRSFHAMASVMVATCFSQNSEMDFDAHTAHFMNIINNSIEMFTMIMAFLPKSTYGVSTVDVGWLPPLYYTAIKCRVQRIRHQAIMLMSVSGHNEGFWDARIAVIVAKDIVKTEEGDFYTGMGCLDGFNELTDPLPAEEELCSYPILAEDRRVSNVQVSLPDGTSESLVVSWQSKLKDGRWELETREHDTFVLAS